MRIKAALALTAATLILSACNQGGVMSASDNWGEANRQTMAAQIIDPAPEYDTINPTTSGDHAADAIDRYNKGAVKQPDRTSTSTIGTGGGN